MPEPTPTETQVRALAVARGIDPDEVVEATLHGGYAQLMWDRLVAAVPAEDPARAAIEAATVRFDPSIAFVAKTYDPRGHVTVRLHLGLLDAINETTDSIVPLMDFDADPAPPITQDLAEEVGIRIAHSLGWLTSRAQHARATPEHFLSSHRADFSHGLALAAQVYVLAHEMGHVAVGDVDEAPDQATSHAREFAADAWAIRLLLSMPEGPPTDDLATLPWPPYLTVAAAAVFLCFERMHELWLGLDRSATHPPAAERLARIRQQVLDTPGADPDILAGFDEIVRLFDFLQRYVDMEHPDHVLSTDEVRDWVAISGGNPETVPDDTQWTYRAAYEYMTIETLREIARRGAITDADVDEVQGLVARMPQVVIDALAKAYSGNLIPASDPDAKAIHRLGQELAGRYTDVPLREAVIPG